MSTPPDALWLNTNPAFRRFNQSLIRHLSYHTCLGEWEYYQSADEPSSLDAVVALLHDYLQKSDRPVHLIGHSTGGLAGLLYARQYPEKVQSLTLLGVGVCPALDWQLHYYTLRKFLPCSREVILAQIIRDLFGYQRRSNGKKLIAVLEQDLNSSPSPHSLYRRQDIAPGGVNVPLLVCGGQNDGIVDINALRGWQKWLKAGDRLWECPEGRHFFHYFHSQQVGRQILKFWKSLAATETALVTSS